MTVVFGVIRSQLIYRSQWYSMDGSAIRFCHSDCLGMKVWMHLAGHQIGGECNEQSYREPCRRHLKIQRNR